MEGVIFFRGYGIMSKAFHAMNAQTRKAWADVYDNPSWGWTPRDAHSVASLLNGVGAHPSNVPLLFQRSPERGRLVQNVMLGTAPPTQLQVKQAKRELESRDRRRQEFYAQRPRQARAVRREAEALTGGAKKRVHFINGNVSSTHDVPYKARSAFIKKHGFAKISRKSKSMMGAVPSNRLMALKHGHELRKWAAQARTSAAP